MVGVNVYVVVAVLFNAGDHIPLMPLSDVVVNADNIAPEHIGVTELKVGVTTAVIVTDVVAITPGQPPPGATVYVIV